MSRQSYAKRLIILAGENLGLITLDNAKQQGIPSVAVHKLAARGEIERVGKGVYRSYLFPITEASAALEAVLAVDSGAILEGESVLSLLEIGDFNPKKYRVRTTTRIQRNLPGNVRAIVGPVEAVEKIAGVPCQPIRLALKEAAKSATRDQIAEAIKQMSSRGINVGADIL